MAIVWYALDAFGSILDHCEAPDRDSAENLLRVTCPHHTYVQSRAEWRISSEERSIRQRNERIKRQDTDADSDEMDCA